MSNPTFTNISGETFVVCPECNENIEMVGTRFAFYPNKSRPTAMCNCPSCGAVITIEQDESIVFEVDRSRT